MITTIPLCDNYFLVVMYYKLLQNPLMYGFSEIEHPVSVVTMHTCSEKISKVNIATSAVSTKVLKSVGNKCLNLKLAPVCSMSVSYCNKGYEASHETFTSNSCNITKISYIATPTVI